MERAGSRAFAAAFLFSAACSSGPIESASDLRAACRDRDPRLEAALAPKTDVVVRLRAIDRDELQRRLGVELFHDDVAWLQVDASDHEQPCCGAHVEARVVERGAEWTARHGADLWRLAGLQPPKPMVLDPKFSLFGLFADFLTRLVTAGTFDFRARGTEEWFPVRDPGTRGTGTPQQQLALARLYELDTVSPSNDLELYAGWADDSAALVAPPPSSPSTNGDAELVVAVTLRLDTDAWMKNACSYTLEQHLPLPPGASVSQRLRAALEEHPELRFGSAR